MTATRDVTPADLSLDRFAEHGCAVVPNVLTPDECDAIIAALPPDPRGDGKRRGGQRLFFRDVPALQVVVRLPRVREVVTTALSSNAFATHVLLFDKTPRDNWAVRWHQDITIAVQAQHTVPSFGPWSTKAGVPHVAAPVSVLNRVVALRLHLDDCLSEHGPLQVRLGSHKHGRVAVDDRPTLFERTPIAQCCTNRDGAVLMHPLAFHHSTKATEPTHRRVLHIEFADTKLPAPLQWHEFVTMM